MATNDFRGIRGRSVLMAILDECAFYRDETSASSDVELYNALTPGTLTLRDSAMMIGISTPHKKSDLLWSMTLRPQWLPLAAEIRWPALPFRERFVENDINFDLWCDAFNAVDAFAAYQGSTVSRYHAVAAVKSAKTQTLG